VKTTLAIIGAVLIFFWAMGALNIGDFVLCFGPHGECQGVRK
jgi:hypothetical protein